MADGALQPPSPPLPEEEHFEIRLSFDRADAALFEREYAVRRQDWLGFVIIGGAVCILVGAIGYSGVLSRWLGVESWWWLVGGAVASVGVWVFAHTVPLVVRVLRGADEPIQTDGWTLVTTTGGLWFESPGDARVRPWTDFKEMIVSDTAIYLGLEARRAIMLPARVFDDRNDFHTFASVMAKYARI